MIVGPEEWIVGQLAQPAGKIKNFHGLVYEIGHFWARITDTSTFNDWVDESVAKFSSFWAMERVWPTRKAAMKQS